MRWIVKITIITALLTAPSFAQSPSPPVDGPAAANCHTTLFGGTTCTQQTAPAQAGSGLAESVSNGCRIGKSAAARLMCADSDLRRIDSMLGKVYRDAKQSASPETQKLLTKEQLDWIRERNEKCGLVGRDNAPIEELRTVKPCIEAEIKARIVALQGAPHDNTQKPNSCQSAKSAAARLICNDPDLADAELAVTKAYEDVTERTSPADQKTIGQTQVEWLQELNRKCALIGRDSAPLDELRGAKQCIEEEIKARFAALRAASQGNLARPAATSVDGSPAQTSQSIRLDPIIEAGASGAFPNQTPVTFQRFRFSVPADNLTGAVSCSAPATYEGSDPFANTPFAGRGIIKIAVAGAAKSAHLFEADAWVAPLDQVRRAAKSACADALASGRLRDEANKPISNLHDAFEVYFPNGVFMAYSVGQNARWVVQTDLPKELKRIQLNLGIQKWVDPEQLARNPYFFIDMVVGVVAQFDRKLSATEAVFAHNGVEIYLAGAKPEHFQGKQAIVLAGRVKGNKGVIESSGDEVLMPALDYTGEFKCGDMCESLGMLETRDVPLAQAEK